MLIAWTTLATRADADRMAAEIVARRLAACVQVEGPVVSHYLWRGKAERSEEHRLCLKFLPSQLHTLEAFVLKHHPYDTPEWIVVEAERAAEKYLSWMESNSTTPPL